MGSFGATENNENRPLYLAKSRFFAGMGASQPRASYSDSPGLVPWPKVVPRAPPRAWAIRRHPQSRRARSWVTDNIDYGASGASCIVSGFGLGLENRAASACKPPPRPRWHVSALPEPGRSSQCPEAAQVRETLALQLPARTPDSRGKQPKTGRAAIDPQRAQASLVIPPGGKRTSSA